MKQYYISDILSKFKLGDEVDIYGWIVSFTKHKHICFIVIEDSTGRINLMIEYRYIDFTIKKEQSVFCTGIITNDIEGKILVHIKKISLLGDVTCSLNPNARSKINVFSERNSRQVVYNKHLYIRNQQFVGIMKARNLVTDAVRAWFKKNGYWEITAPILTPILLYDQDTGISVNIKQQNVFLTQCVGFYLESAVHSLEKVYNVGPSFRGAESISKRHLMEYWHIKSELAFCSFEEYFDVVESLIHDLTTYVLEHGGKELIPLIGTDFCIDGLNIPFPRITYNNAVKLLNDNGIVFTYGKSLNNKSEKFLSEYFNGPVWVTHKPKCIEGFPYRCCEDDANLTKTADLLASRGFGEILGIAEKITDVYELRKNLEEKNKPFADYKWFCDLREYGTVQHCGFGMGLERLIRWMFCMNHVKDVIPFPRRINKKIYP